MMDPFVVLGLEPRPVIDEAVVRERYRQLAREAHPDSKNGNADPTRFAELGVARDMILDTARRLKSLAGSNSSSRDAGITDLDLFGEIGTIANRGRTLRTRLAHANALSRALMLEEVTATVAEITRLHRVTSSRLDEVKREVSDCDRDWPDVDPVRLVGLAKRWERLSGWQADLKSLRLDFL